VVLNGSKLEKAYSANVFNDLFNSFDTGKAREHAVSESKNYHQTQHHHENIQNENALVFSGNSGSGLGHYAHVGDDEKESENDKLNKEIKKRKKNRLRIGG
jgi:hypothetical protein